MPSRPRHKIQFISSNSCNHQAAAYRLEPRTALRTSATSEYNPGNWFWPGYLKTSRELHWGCSRTLRSIRGLFMILTDLLLETDKMNREPEEAGTPPKDPFYQEVTPAPGPLHPSGWGTGSEASNCQQHNTSAKCTNSAVLCRLRAAQCSCMSTKAWRHASTTPSNLLHMLMATILWATVPALKEELWTVNTHTWVCSWKSAAL